MHAAKPLRKGALIRRSMLCGPSTSETFITHAATTAADAVMLDLENTVPLSRKTEARHLVRGAIARVSDAGRSDTLVRVNGTWDLMQHDLDACVSSGLKGIVVPDAESPDLIACIDRDLTDLERMSQLPVGQTQIALTIESVAGLAKAQELIAASPRVVSIMLGAEDFARDIGVEPTAGAEEIRLPLQQLVLVARLGGVAPLGGMLGGLFAINDLELTESSARWHATVGFRGGACVTEAQVTIANRVFSPDPAAVSRAQAMIARYAEAEADGDGFVEFDGGLIDVPMVKRARTLVDRATEISNLDRRHARRIEGQL